jgi:hypothetical protein
MREQSRKLITIGKYIPLKARETIKADLVPHIRPIWIIGWRKTPHRSIEFSLFGRVRLLYQDE